MVVSISFEIHKRISEHKICLFFARDFRISTKRNNRFFWKLVIASTSECMVLFWWRVCAQNRTSEAVLYGEIRKTNNLKCWFRRVWNSKDRVTWPDSNRLFSAGIHETAGLCDTSANIVGTPTTHYDCLSQRIFSCYSVFWLGSKCAL